RGRPDAQLAPLGHGFDRVEAEVPQHLPEPLRVHPPDEGGGERPDDLEAARGGAVLEQEENALEHVGDVDHLEGERRGAGVLEEVRDDLIEPFGLPQDYLRSGLLRVACGWGAGMELYGA